MLFSGIKTELLMSIVIILDFESDILNTYSMKAMLAVLFLSIFLTSNAQKGETLSKWSNYPQGNPGLTTQDYHSYEKGRLLVYLSNDDSCLYIDMKIPETADQNSIFRSGLTLWISTDGKHHKINGIKFPTGFRRPGSRAMGPGPSNNNLDPIDMAKTIALIGFGNAEPEIIPTDSKNNVRGVLWYDKIRNLYYRLTIPLKKLPGTDKEAAAQSGHLALGIEYNDFSSNMVHGGGMGSPSGGMGGRGMSHGGGYGGGMGSGGRGMHGGSSSHYGQGGGQYPSSSTMMLWIKNITLAVHQ